MTLPRFIIDTLSVTALVAIAMILLARGQDLQSSLLLLGMFALACALPAGFYQAKFVEEGGVAYGWRLAALGWMALVLPEPAALAWFAGYTVVRPPPCCAGRS